MKRCQKGCFLSPISSKITLTKEKQSREKETARRKKGGEEKKSNGCTLNFYNGYFEFVAEKKLFDGGGPFSSDVFKIRLDINKHF